MNTEDIISKLGFEQLNAMQADASQAVLHGDKDVVILSPTGSGKTLAYLLPLVQRMDTASDSLQAVVLVPGRELAMQSAGVLRSMGAGVRGMSLYGGRPAMDEHRELRKARPHVVFATPGRMNDHLDKGNVDAKTVRWLVIDEFDKCLEMGFRDEMGEVIGKLPAVDRRILLSATDAEEIPGFVNMGRTVRVDYSSGGEQVPDRVRLYKVSSHERDKLAALGRLLRCLGDESTVVFLNHRDAVERTAGYLLAEGFSVSSLHGGMEQKQREDSLYRFANGSANILVSTDLASRGLDMPEVADIIHYHLPESEDAYVHRVGRTARWDATGRAFFLLGPSEDVPRYVECAPEEYAMPEEPPAPARPRMATLYIGKGKKDKISKGDIVGFLCKKGGLKPDDIGRIDVRERYSYAAVARQRLAGTLRLVAGEKIKGLKTIIEEVRQA